MYRNRYPIRERAVAAVLAACALSGCSIQTYDGIPPTRTYEAGPSTLPDKLSGAQSAFERSMRTIGDRIVDIAADRKSKCRPNGSNSFDNKQALQANNGKLVNGILPQVTLLFDSEQSVTTLSLYDVFNSKDMPGETQYANGFELTFSSDAGSANLENVIAMKGKLSIGDIRNFIDSPDTQLQHVATSQTSTDISDTLQRNLDGSYGYAHESPQNTTPVQTQATPEQLESLDFMIGRLESQLSSAVD